MHRCCITGNRFFVQPAMKRRENMNMFGYISRNRAVWYILAQHLYGEIKILQDCNINKEIKGLGLGEHQLSSLLSKKYSYKNFTVKISSDKDILDENVYIDLYKIDFRKHNNYDFIICSEILNHIAGYPGINIILHNLHTMLKPSGVLILTTPYMHDGIYIEKYPSLYNFTFLQVKEASTNKWFIKNTTVSGKEELISDLLMYNPSDLTSIEMRKMNETSLYNFIEDAAFKDIKFHSITTDMNRYGIYWDRGNDDKSSLVVSAIH